MTQNEKQRAILIDAIDWAAGQDARNRLGLPSAWVQGMWISQVDGVSVGNHCGTAACIAGYVTLVHEDVSRDDALSSWRVRTSGGEYQLVEVMAQDSLGLNDSQARALFDEDNTLGDLIDITRQILNDVPQPIRHRDGVGGYGFEDFDDDASDDDN